MKLNDKQLRAAFKHKSTSSLAFSGIASRLIYRDSVGIEHYEQIKVFGNRTKTVQAVIREGYKELYTTIGKFPATAQGYADAAQTIEHYFDD